MALCMFDSMRYSKGGSGAGCESGPWGLARGVAVWGGDLDTAEMIKSGIISLSLPPLPCSPVSLPRERGGG